MTIQVYSKSSSPLGTSIWTFTGIVAPAQFIPTLTESASENKQGSNVNYRAKVSYPLAHQVDGIWVADNTISASFSFTALQNVIATTEKLRVIDELIAHITLARERIAAGRVTD